MAAVEYLPADSVDNANRSVHIKSVTLLMLSMRTLPFVNIGTENYAFCIVADAK